MKPFLLTVFIALTASFSFGQGNDDYKSSLKKLMQISGTEVVYKGALIQMTTMFKQQQPNVPTTFWDEFTAEAATTDSFNQLLNLMLPIYKKHLTETDLIGVIAFYETPVGKKFAEKAPLITLESMLAGQEWGKQLGEKIVTKLKAEGYMKEPQSKQ